MNRKGRPNTLGIGKALLRKQRREVCSASLEAFGRTYLPGHFQAPPSPMHKELFSLLEEITVGHQARVAGHSKLRLLRTSFSTLAFLVRLRREQRCAPAVFGSGQPRPGNRAE